MTSELSAPPSDRGSAVAPAVGPGDRPFGYAVITPARDEEAHLPRLAASLASQAIRPDRWIIVENSSTDKTRAIADGLAQRHDWVRVRTASGSAEPERGAPIVRALHAGVGDVEPTTGVVVNVDADVSMESGYFERLLGNVLRRRREAFVVEDPRSGTWSWSRQSRSAACARFHTNLETSAGCERRPPIAPPR